MLYNTINTECQMQKVALDLKDTIANTSDVVGTIGAPILTGLYGAGTGAATGLGLGLYSGRNALTSAWETAKKGGGGGVLGGAIGALLGTGLGTAFNKDAPFRFAPAAALASGILGSEIGKIKGWRSALDLTNPTNTNQDK